MGLPQMGISWLLSGCASSSKGAENKHGRCLARNVCPAPHKTTINNTDGCYDVMMIPVGCTESRVASLLLKGKI